MRPPSSCARVATCSTCLASPWATTATSLTAPIKRVAGSSSYWLAWAARPSRRAPCGGHRTTATPTPPEDVHDLRHFPELRCLEYLHWAPAALLAGLCFWVGGWSGLVVGFLLSNVLSHHAVFLVNSACHLWGRRRYATADASRNNAVVAVLTLGEGWHNNHHHYQSSANQGFRWWELDVSYSLIRLLACLGLVWDVRTPPPAKVAS